MKNVTKEESIARSKEFSPPGTPQKHRFKQFQLEIQKEIFEAAKKRDMHAALIAYHKLTDGTKIDAPVYTALIKACGPNIGEAVQIYTDMKIRKAIPNIQTFLTLAKCCLESNHVPRAMFFMKEMLKYTQIPKKKKKQKPYIEFFQLLLR